MRLVTKYLLCLLFCVLGAVLPIYATLWHSESRMIASDTYPSVLQMLTGHFIRHSEAYYNWKVLEMEQKILETPDSILLYDDLAVAYFYIGNHAKAIETMKQKNELDSNAYTTQLNLATFYFHQADFVHALEQLNVILEANNLKPRDVYHKYIMEYVFIKTQFEELKLPLQGKISMKELVKKRTIDDLDNFYTFLQRTINGATNKTALKTETLHHALIGVLQVMRFSKHDSPILLEILGDLLLAYGTGSLASMAYLRAAELVVDEKAIKAYTLMAEEALIIKQRIKPKRSLGQVSSFLIKEQKRSNQFFSKIKKHEKFWIESGLHPQTEFTQKYFPNYDRKDSTLFFPYENDIEIILSLQGEMPDIIPVDTLHKPIVLKQILSKQKVKRDEEKVVEKAESSNDIKKARIRKTLGLVILINLLISSLLYMKFRKKDSQ